MSTMKNEKNPVLIVPSFSFEKSVSIIVPFTGTLPSFSAIFAFTLKYGFIGGVGGWRRKVSLLLFCCVLLLLLLLLFEVFFVLLLLCFFVSCLFVCFWGGRYCITFYVYSW